MNPQDEIHSCSYYCNRPECIKAQRDELREGLQLLNAKIDELMKELSDLEQLTTKSQED